MIDILNFIIIMTMLLGMMPENKIKAIANFFKDILPRLPKKWF